MKGAKKGEFKGGVQKVECKRVPKRGSAKEECKKWSAKGVSAEGEVQKGNPNEPKDARVPTATCGFNRLRAFRRAKILE